MRAHRNKIVSNVLSTVAHASDPGRRRNKRKLRKAGPRRPTPQPFASIVGQKGPFSIPNSHPEAGAYQVLEKWDWYIREWKESLHPDPNEFLTLDLPRDELDIALANGKSISAFKTRYLDQMRRMLKSSGYPWLAAWVIEVKNLPHIHILIWLPEDEVFRDKFYRWLGKRFPIPIVDPMTPISLSENDTGLPVNIKSIDPEAVYTKTLKKGLEGLRDYMGKAIVANGMRKRGRRIGQIVGRSRELAKPPKP